MSVNMTVFLYQDSRYRHPSWRDEVPQNRPEYDREQRERARLYQTSSSSTSQDGASINGYQEQAARVAGDSDGWHVVGDNAGTASVGKGAAPSETQRTPQASDTKTGYYVDSYGRQVPVWDTNGRPRVESEGQMSPQIGSGTHAEGQRPVVSQSGDGQVPSGHSDVQTGYYTDHYGRQVPVGSSQQVGQGVGVSNTGIGQGVSDGTGGIQVGQGVSAHDIGDGARAADSRIGQGAGVSWGSSEPASGGTGTVGQGVRPNEQERVSFPNSQGDIGQGAQSGSHMARLHRPTIVKDEYGTVYKQTVIDGQVHYIPDADAVQPVRPDPRLVSNPRVDLESEQWKRQQEHMRIAEEERRLQEQAIRDRWAQGQGGQETIEHVPELPPRREEPVPLEKDEEIEEEPLQIPERLPAPRPVPVEDDEDDS